MKINLLEIKRHPFSFLVRMLVWLAAAATLAVLLFMIIFIVVNGVPYIRPSLFALEYNSDNVSLFPALVNTLIMTALCLLIALPLGMFSAIYLVEYAKKGSKIVRIIRMTAETLSGIPSIIYGLFGMLFFCTAFGGYSILAGTLTMAIMVLPLIMRTTEEALIAVPDMYREASFGLGAGKLRTIFRIILPGGGSRNPFRRYSGDRTCGRRDGRADLHRRYGGRHPRKPVQVGTYPGYSYVQPVP